MPTVGSFMTKDVVTIDVEETCLDAARKMGEQNISCLVVTEDGVATGIVTERDFLNNIVVEGRDPGATRVREIMSSPLKTASPDVQIKEAVSKMMENEIRRLVVMKDERLEGILTETDITRVILGTIAQ